MYSCSNCHNRLALSIFLECGMKFRLSRQRKANLEPFDLKTICPSLHDDPAFSADPHSNPYSVTSHNSWLSPPRLDHPVLKNNKIPLAPHGITADSDSDFQPVQPPNSPDIPSGPSPQYLNPLTIYNKLPTLLNTSSSSTNQGPTSVMSQVVRRSSVLKKENKQTSFLSRRQSAQPQSIKSFFSSIGKKAHRRSDLPAALGNTTLPLQPAQPTEDLPSSASVAPRKVLGNRGWVQDLDQIDQLDETNPWGIRIHHDGPYEAANSQVNKRAGHVPLGLASSNAVYNTLALQANYQVQV
jgi:Pal1 cell morphology protein